MRLSEQRSIGSDANTMAKVFIVFCSILGVGYILFISIGLAIIANTATTFTPGEMLTGILPVFLAVDFALRIAIQHTPVQLVKPYLLLPLSRYSCTDAFIISSILTPNNLFWMLLTVPYVIMTTVFSMGFLPALSLVIVVQLIFTANSLFYMLCRTLWTESLLWASLPIAFFVALFSPVIYGGVVGKHFYDGFEQYFDSYSPIGEAAIECNLSVYLFIALLLVVLFLINRIVQRKYIYAEARKEKDTTVKYISTFSLLDRFNQIGEYLKLEFKSMLRNRNPRISFITIILTTVMVSIMNSLLHDDSDNFFSGTMGAAYPFTLVSINLISIMCPEGNYIECLLVHKENIKTLLLAKYYFYLSMLLLPFILMLPTVFSGHYSFLVLFAMVTFTAGPVFFMAMQLAVYNKNTTSLNVRLTGKAGNKVQYLQIFTCFVVLLAPAFIMESMQIIIGEAYSAIILSLIGLAFVIFHKRWINNIYRRMMKRKHTNLEGFLQTR